MSCCAGCAALRRCCATAAAPPGCFDDGCALRCCLHPQRDGLHQPAAEPLPVRASWPLLRSVRLEHQIEADYRGSLQQQCYNERMLQVGGRCRELAWGGAVHAAQCPPVFRPTISRRSDALPGWPLPPAATLPLLWAQGGGAQDGAQELRGAEQPVWRRRQAASGGGRRRLGGGVSTAGAAAACSSVALCPALRG